jgi:hypothetical protein
MKLTGVRRAKLLGAAGVLAMAVTTATASPAQAHGDPNDSYKNASTSKGVSVDSDRTYDQGTNRTTFTFTLSLTGSEPVSHVLLMACPDVPIVSTSGPNGAAKVEGETPKEDPSIKDGAHSGVKFQPGTAGTYTIVFTGNIAAAQFVIKDGNGHAHFTEGQESDICKTVQSTPQENPPAENPPVENPPASNPPAENPPAENPPSAPASNAPRQPGAEVQGETQTNPTPPSTDVIGAQQGQPEALGATLPRTGSEAGFLASIGVLLAAFGSVARAACRRP